MQDSLGSSPIFEGVEFTVNVYADQSHLQDDSNGYRVNALLEALQEHYADQAQLQFRTAWDGERYWVTMTTVFTTDIADNVHVVKAFCEGWVNAMGDRIWLC